MKRNGPRLVLAVVVLTFAALVFVLPGLSGAQGGRLTGVTLRVGTFGGSWKDAVHKEVGRALEAQGAKIEYVVGNPAENLAKIVAARSRAVPIDVMEIGPAERIAMIKEGFLDDVPVPLIPNIAKVPKQGVEKNVVAYLIVQNGIVYRADRFAEENIPVPTKYGDLVHPKLANRVAVPDVTNTQHWTSVAALAYEGGGSEAAPEKGFERVQQMKPLYFFSAASELATKFSLGDVLAAPWHAGWAVRLARSGMHVGFVHPQVGGKRGAIELNYLGIVKGTENTEAAAAFVNAFLDTQAQVSFARTVGIVPTNREARAQLEKDDNLKKFMLLTDKEIDGAFMVDWDRVDQNKWRAAWSRVIGK